ncbi:hypothetical protein [Robertkochia flava]|uniref:hypothetical protein n=1 Tax=Robertkochia flava TaxID=3447986 RepID=UPI001CC93F3A|nr:hypothetical protein [Robertkochia marina]
MNQSEQSQATPKSYLQTFTIIHLALIAGPVISMIFLLEVPEEWSFQFSENFEISHLIPVLISTGSLIASEILFKQYISKYDRTNSLKEKMGQLFTSYLIRFAILEGAAFYCIITNPDSSNPLFLMCAIIPLIAMVLLFPRKEKIIELLKLSKEQKMQFMKLNEIIN